MNKGKFYDSASPHDDFSNLFKKKKNTDKHAPMKQKRVKGNGAPFMTREI